MELELGFSITVAAAVGVVAVSYAAAVLGRLARLVVFTLAGLLFAATAAAATALVLQPSGELAVACAALAAATLAELGALAITQLARRARRIEQDAAEAEQRLRDVLERETATNAAELERTLARARADAMSVLAEAERRLAEERRIFLAEREQNARDELGAALGSVQRQVEQRIAEWSADLERTQQGFASELTRMRERQQALIGQIEARVAVDAERIASESEEQRAELERLRTDVSRIAAEAAAAARAELESHALERRRALDDVANSLRKREQALREQVEREEAEAVRRLQAGFADVERRQLEHLERVVDRAAASYSDAAAQQFGDAIKNAREDAARRLGRELDRAVAQFDRDAAGLLAERLGHVADAGTQRLEKRFNQLAVALERERDRTFAAFETRLGEAEGELRRRLEAFTADIEAERAILDARLHELSRRIEETFARTP